MLPADRHDLGIEDQISDRAAIADAPHEQAPVPRSRTETGSARLRQHAGRSFACFFG